MHTLYLVSHTHWDREWYLTFQQFRLKLVHLIDNLLALLDADPDYKHFTLDGQTIVLDDYLLVRPERAPAIRAHVQGGRLLIGPWHILPDEFLVSPEATVRNLLQGDRTARQFGPKMMVGYTPDPFGHIGQMPQILRGFGIETASVARGLMDEPCELWWEAPDGSRVLLAYLRDSYDNAAQLPTGDPARFVSKVCRLRDSLVPHTATPHILLMHGTDHMEPRPDTSAALAHAQGKLDGDILIHSTLPAYLAAVQSPISNLQSPIPVVRGELRSSKRHHLLPGVLSARMWIKQRNHACETLLEKWAEPFSAWANLANLPESLGPSGRLTDPAPIVRQAWRMLMECHPHDSICGCSIDQVHDEMRSRFDQVEQVGEEVTRQSLATLVAAIDTAQSKIQNPKSAIIAFDPVAGPCTDAVTISLELRAGMDEFEIMDEAGHVLPHQVVGTGSREIASVSLDRDELQGALAMAQEGKIMGMLVCDAGFRREGNTLLIDILMTESGQPDESLKRALHEFEELLADETLNTFVVKVRTAAATTVRFMARDVPGCGYRTFWVRPGRSPVSEQEIAKSYHAEAQGAEASQSGAAETLRGLAAQSDRPNTCQSVQSVENPCVMIENEFLAVQVAPEDGTLTVKDKRTGTVYCGLNRFVDDGDCGDEYNYCPPASDVYVIGQAQAIHSECGDIQPTGGLRLQSHVISLTMPVPAALTEDRQSRSTESVPVTITTRATLTPGVPRVDIVTEVDNLARDHRLRVHFPAPFAVTAADHDGHFEVVRRSTGVPAFDESWIEQPRPEVPQRAFTDISDGNVGLTIANRGLPEVEVLRASEGSTEIALTLLRCVGWLSHDDLSTRKRHAGPMLATPGAQMIGRHTFEYSIIPHAGGWQNAYQAAYAFDAPMRAVATSIHAGPLPQRAALVQAQPEQFVISAVKTAEDGSGLIVRGYNIGAEAIHVTLTPWRKFARAAQVRLDETEEAELVQAGGGAVTFVVYKHEIATVKFSDLNA